MFPFHKAASRSVTYIVLIVCLSLTLSSCGGGGAVALAFEAPTNIATGGITPTSVVVADFNGDRKLDIAVSNSASGTISVFLNKGNGTFGNPIVSPIQIATEGISALAVGDFNEDGKPDLIVGSSQGDVVLLGKGDGTFQELSPIPNSFDFFTARVADLNHDGHEDFVTVDTSGVRVFLGRGDGTFTETSLPALPGLSGIYSGLAVGDFNGDKSLDIVASGPTFEDPPGTVVFYAGRGDGTFQLPVAAPIPPSPPTELASADFNGDGNLDLLVGIPYEAGVVPGNGNATFKSGQEGFLPVYSGQVVLPPTGGFLALQVADFNLDGKPDALVGAFDSGVVTLVLNGGIGINPTPADAQFQFTLAPGINDLAVGDLNGDGIPDIVASNGTTNEISVILSKRN